MHARTSTLLNVLLLVVFFFNDTATTEIYTLSLHDALPILVHPQNTFHPTQDWLAVKLFPDRSEEHTSELQSLAYLVCRLLLEKNRDRESVRPPRPARETSDRIRPLSTGDRGRPFQRGGRCFFFHSAAPRALLSLSPQGDLQV